MLRLMMLFLQAFFHTSIGRLRRGPLRPSWSFRFEWVVTGLRRDWDEMHRWPAFRIREELEGRELPKTHSRRVKRSPETIGGVPGEWFDPPAAAADSLLIYLHGGSYLFGSTHTHAEIIARMALTTGMRTFAPNYRLAPEHPYPAQLEDARAIYLAFLARPLPADRIVLAGESAGGNLILSTLIALREAGDPLPAAAAVFSPWSDLSSAQPSIESNADFDFGTRSMLIDQARQFAGALPLDDPRISPLFADLGGLCPLRIHAGESELLFDECRQLAERARDAGSDVTFEALRDMPHAAELLADFSPVGAAALERAGAWLRARALD